MTDGKAPGATSADAGQIRASSRDTGRAELRWGGLMAASQDGDAAAYRMLLGEVNAWLRRYFSGRLPPAIAEDAVQDTLLALHEKRHTYDPARPFGPWLAAIARYKWIDRLRALNSNRTETLTEELAVADHAAAVEGAFALGQLMRTLKPSQAEVIRLVKLEGLSIEQASLRTGQSVPLVKVNIHRGLRKLTALVKTRADVG